MSTTDPNSVTGYTRDELLALGPGLQVPWLAEAEDRFGTLQRHHAMQFRDGRVMHITAFARGWRWALCNPQADPPMETDIWLTPEAMDGSLMLISLCKEALGIPPDKFYQALEDYLHEEPAP